MNKVPIGTDAQGAREYLGCSQSMFDELRKRRFVVPLRKNWYSYDDLDHAIRLVRKERDLGLKRDDERAPQSLSSQKSARNVGGKRIGSNYPSTKDLLREIS